MSVVDVVKQLPNSNYVAPITDGDLGWRAFFAGLDINRLRNDEQRAAWLEAETAAALHPSRFSQGDEVEVRQ